MTGPSASPWSLHLLHAPPPPTPAHCIGRRPETITNSSFGLFADSGTLAFAGAASSCCRTWIRALCGHRRVHQSWSDAKRARHWRERGSLSSRDLAQPMSRAPRVRAPDALLMMQSAQLRPWLSMESWQRCQPALLAQGLASVSYTHLRAHETPEHLVCRLLLEKKK